MSAFRPVNADTSIVFALAPPVSSATSKLAMASTAPLLVRRALVSVKSVSPASNRVSTPTPPSIALAPPPPLMRSSPSPPDKLSAPAAPISRSSPAPPRNATEPLKPDASSRSAPEVPSTATRWMFASALTSVLPSCTVVAVTPPPTRPSDVAVTAVMVGWSRPPCEPVKVMTQGPPSSGCDTNTSPSFRAFRPTSAL